MQQDIDVLISKLHKKAQAWQNKKALAKHGLHAYEMLEELKHYKGSKGAWEDLPVCRILSHDMFTKGVTSSKPTSLRLLIKVDLLVSMLRNGALEQRGVLFNIGRAEEVDKEMYFIQGGTYSAIRFNDVTEGPNGFFKALELSANFETVIERYCFNNIPKSSDDDKKKFLKKFADVVEAEKRRQLFHNLFPHTLPWTVRDVWTMPVVIWLRKGS